jgi:nucleoside-diphosphate-sugar epimerase
MTRDSIRGARVLVTGAGGFIGRHLTAELMRRGAEVHGTSRAAHASDEAGVRWRRCDLGQATEVQSLFAEARPDYVFHLSSMADGRRDLDLVIPIFHSETAATVNVLTAACAAGIRRLVFPGSLEEPERGEPPSSPYAAAKAASRSYARMFHQLYQLPVVMTRIFMTYGPGQPDWKLIPATAGRLLRGEAPVIASPDRKVDWVYVTDVVAGLIRALMAPGLEGISVDLGSGRLVTIRDVVERLRMLIDPSVEADYGNAGPRPQEQVRQADVAESGRLLGWHPRVDLDEGLRQTVGMLQSKVRAAH